MTTGDGRHKIGSAREAALHRTITGVCRAMVDGYCARRHAEEHERLGYELKKTIVKEEIAEVLGVTLRTLDAYCLDTPITLAKAALLCSVTGRDDLLQFFAQQMGAVAVTRPSPEEIAGMAEVNAEIYANHKEFHEFQGAVMAMADEDYGPAQHALTRKEGLEDIRQSLRVLGLSELKAHGEIRDPILLRATRQFAANTGGK